MHMRNMLIAKASFSAYLLGSFLLEIGEKCIFDPKSPKCPKDAVLTFQKGRKRRQKTGVYAILIYAGELLSRWLF